MKKDMTLFLLLFSITQFVSAQNVGIGLDSPKYKLDVAGSVHASGNGYVDGYFGVGTSQPGYKFQVNNGPVALYNTTDAKTWYFYYSSLNNYFYLSENGANRMVVKNGGNVGIGTSTPEAKLDVAGNVNVDGNLTVSGNKGVMRNAAGGAQLRYYTREASFSASIGALGTSPEGTINFDGGFNSPPQVLVGNLVTTGGTSGPLFRCQLVIYNVTKNSCKCRIINTANSSINQNFTWNIICIGS